MAGESETEGGAVWLFIVGVWLLGPGLTMVIAEQLAIPADVGWATSVIGGLLIVGGVLLVRGEGAAP